MKKMYVVRYYGGSYEDSWDKIIFVTDNKSKATKYVTKFNNLLKNWKEYYSRFEEKSEFGFKWIKEEHVRKYFNRWERINDISKCYWNEIEVR